MWGSEFRVKGRRWGVLVVGFRVWGVECGVWGVGCGMRGGGCELWGVGCGVWGVSCGEWGSGWGVRDSEFSCAGPTQGGATVTTNGSNIF